MKRLFLLILIIPSLLLGQTKDELDLCMAIQGNSFSTNTAAENALNRILNTIGASKNFVLSPCDKINNAVATAYKGTRYILYDKEFMNLINRNTNDWSNLFVLAHEVGHHINGHSIDVLLYTSDIVEPKSLAKKREQELEADEFAAFVLAKLGANLSQLNNIITLISNNSDDTYSTHPKRSKRLASVRNGYNKGYVRKETRTVIINNASSKYEKKKNFIRYGQWYKGKPSDPFSDIKHGAIVSGKIFSKNDTNGLVAPSFTISSFKDKIDGTCKPYGLSYAFLGLKKWVPFTATHLKLTAEIKILNSVGDVMDSAYLSGRTGGWYEDEYVAAFFDFDDVLIVNKTGPLYMQNNTFCFDNFKKGSKMLVKFSVENAKYNPDPNRYETKYDKVSAPLLSNTYFEYSLSGSSKALSF